MLYNPKPIAEIIHLALKRVSPKVKNHNFHKLLSSLVIFLSVAMRSVWPVQEVTKVTGLLYLEVT